MAIHPYVTIVGGGIIGLSCAWRLHQSGCVVTVIDAAPESREASWAAAGMLAPHNEGESANHIWQFGAESLERWPSFLAEASIDAGAVDYRDHGSLAVATDEDSEAALQARAEWLQAAGVAAELIARDAVLATEPAVSPSVSSGLLAPAAR